MIEVGGALLTITAGLTELPKMLTITFDTPDFNFHNDYLSSACTVKPPNRGHFGDGPFVPCREVVLFSEVLF